MKISNKRQQNHGTHSTKNEMKKSTGKRNYGASGFQNEQKNWHNINYSRMQPNPYSIRTGSHKKVLNFIHFFSSSKQ